MGQSWACHLNNLATRTAGIVAKPLAHCCGLDADATGRRRTACRWRSTLGKCVAFRPCMVGASPLAECDASAFVPLPVAAKRTFGFSALRNWAPLVTSMLLGPGPTMVQATWPEDTALVVRWLTPSQEQGFRSADGILSSFWGDSAYADSLLLSPTTSVPCSGTVWDSDTDAQVLARAAGGVLGLYLLLRVSDDHWVVATGDLDVFVDTVPAAHIRRSIMYDVNPGIGTFTGTTKVAEVTISAPQGVDSAIVYGFSDPNFALGMLQRVALVMPGLSSRFPGMAMEGVVSAGARAIEWRIPWGEIARRNSDGAAPPSVIPAANSRYGFSVGYYDFDSTGGPGNLLAWIGGTPWVDDPNRPSHWGDLLFGPGFPSVPTPVESLLALSPRLQLPRDAATAAEHVRYHTLSGQRVHVVAHSSRPPKRVLVGRTRSGIGFVVAGP